MSGSAPTRGDPAALPLKLLRHALSPTAGDDVAARWAVLFARAARRAGVTVDQLAAAVVPLPSSPAPAEPTLPVAWFVRVPGGRLAGATLGHVAQHDLAYLRWIARKCNDLDVRAAAAAVLAFVTARSADRGTT